jgi:hypothetical protein
MVSIRLEKVVSISIFDTISLQIELNGRNSRLCIVLLAK